MLAIILTLIILILVICALFTSIKILRGGNKTSIQNIGDLVDIYYRCCTSIPKNYNVIRQHNILSRLDTEFEKLRKTDKYIIHGFAEAFICAEMNNHTIRNVQDRTSSGSYNIVIFCDYDDKRAVLRIAKVTERKEPKFLHRHASIMSLNRRVFNLLRNRELIVIPMLSSSDFEHNYEYDTNIYPVSWSVLPFLQVYNNHYFKAYLHMLIDIIPIIHDNGLVYLDWKHDNVMVDDGKVVISDIDFVEVANCEKRNIKCSHYVPPYLLEKVDVNREFVKRIDNLIVVRDMLLSLAADIDYQTSISSYCNVKSERFYDDDNQVITLLHSHDAEIDKLYNKYNLTPDNLTDNYTVEILTSLLNHLENGTPITTKTMPEDKDDKTYDYYSSVSTTSSTDTTPVFEFKPLPFMLKNK